MFNVNAVREDFPILSTAVHGKPLVYLDNAATMQVPVQVVRAMEEQYRLHHANIHRGIHYLSEQSTMRVEQARKTVQQFIGAAYPEEIIFTSGTTQSINIAASSFGAESLLPGDEVLVSAMEHHSNLIPWQQVCKRTGAQLKIIPLTAKGDLDMTAYQALLSDRTALVSVTYVSNVLGTVNPVGELIELAHHVGAVVFLDCAQAMRHAALDVHALDCDLMAFSGHKIMAPTGTGVLYGKRSLLDRLPPVMFGGGMVDEVTLESATFGELPFKFEAGTQNISGIIGLDAAIRYLQALGLDQVSAWEDHLLALAETGMRQLPELDILGAPTRRAGALSFQLRGMHCFDTAKLLDQLGIAVRSGNHCAQPLLTHYGLTGTVRVSPAFYNTEEEIDALLQGLRRVALLVPR